ncbi:MAG: hypothetical protein ACP5SF_03765 [Thermoplasmata archaeon]
MNNKFYIASEKILVSSIFSVFVTLSMAYLFNIIYLIGDSRQLGPLFIGILIGTFFYSIFGSFLNKFAFVYCFIISFISLVLVFYILYSTNMIIGNEYLFIISFLITSPIMPVTQFFERKIKIKNRIIISAIASIIFVILILIFAILYEISGQTILPLGISVFGYLSLIIFVIMAVHKGGNVNGN